MNENTIQTNPSKKHLLEDMHPALARRAQRALAKQARRKRLHGREYADGMLRSDTRLDGFDEERIRKAEDRRQRRAIARAAQ
jgi:hypothetical protein